MGLVDYSDSESDNESVAKPTPAAPAASGGKKPFQKVVDRSNPGKIRVNLPQSSARDEDGTSTNDNEPPAKRARKTGGGAFGGFNSFLPPPKNPGKSTSVGASSSGKTAPKPGVNLKTGAAPAFSRDADDGEGDFTQSNGSSGTSGGGVNLPAPKAQQPSIPADQKPADEVKLVGKPLMFKPLSVSRKPGKKNVSKPPAVPKNATAEAPASSASPRETTQPTEAKEEPPPPPKKPKVSLFSISDDTPAEPEPASHSSGAYEPMFVHGDEQQQAEAAAAAFAAYDAEQGSDFASAASAAPPPTHASGHDTLDSLAASMNLSAAARRELFGRDGGAGAAGAARVVNFDTGREYAHNEALRAAGDQAAAAAHNPVRAIAPGKHSLRQLVNQVHTQRDALEESFAKGKGAQREAGSRYGWR
ncbi:hypothetical protein F4780DRAFT_783720 [Xylariomycetidae sp. FL0641]|nr:hypothetical protein F4780DRAFT_783720 [Xylariomycetidae sp. FL0641]